MKAAKGRTRTRVERLNFMDAGDAEQVFPKYPRRRRSGDAGRSLTLGEKSSAALL
jgi:hypothetical protein